MNSVDINEDLRRLRWQCRRGLLELDLVFGRFLAEHYLKLSADEQAAFRRLLRQPDPTVLSWLQGQSPPEDLKKIVTLIR